MTAIPAPIRTAVLERDGVCLRCRGPLGHYYSVHHRKGRGGPAPHSMANIVALCGSGTTGCHGWVHAHPEESYHTGWLIRRLGKDDPASIPVLDLMGNWWFVGEVLSPFVAAAVPAAVSPPVGPSEGAGANHKPVEGLI